MSFDEPEGAFALSSDDKQWSDWLSQEGSAIVPLGTLGLPSPEPEPEPSQQEWAELEIQSRAALRMAKAQALGSESD